MNGDVGVGDRADMGVRVCPVAVVKLARAQCPGPFSVRVKQQAGIVQLGTMGQGLKVWEAGGTP